jgi:Haem-binding domain
MLLWVKRVTLASVVFLVVIQIFRPAISNPPVDPKREIHASLAVEPAVATVLTRACNDCHSNRTVWPWYSHVAPVSWLVVSDVNRGRKALNFSEWTGYPAEDQQKQLSEICKEVSEGEMPNLAYTLMHRHAKLSTDDVAAICRWTRTSVQLAATASTKQ